jgi:hypothetical protein
VIRALNPSGLRIGLSNKSIEKCFLDTTDNQELIEEFEQEVFGYRIRPS